MLGKCRAMTIEELRKTKECICDFKKRTETLMEMLRRGERPLADSFGFRYQLIDECDYCYLQYVEGYNKAMKGAFD